MMQDLEFRVFDPSPCGFPRPRVPVLPDGVSGLSLWPRRHPRWTPPSNIRHLSLGRYALREAYRLAGIGPGSALLAPAYHCRTMIDPALALGAKVILYPLGNDLSPTLDAFDNLASRSEWPIRAVLATHFFGLPKPFAALASWCSQRSIALIEDCSHVLQFDRHRPPSTGCYGDFVISSPYKFLPSPDGGVLFARQADRLDQLRLRPRSYVAEVRGILRAFSLTRDHQRNTGRCQVDSIKHELAALSETSLSRGGDSISHELLSGDYRPADEGLAPLRFSEFIWRHADISKLARRRQDNYRRWSAALSAVAGCHRPFPDLPEGCIPYMFPLHVAKPNPHFYLLKHLGMPIWRWDNIAASDCATAVNYRLHLLHLPCHQAIAKNEMDWMIQAVKTVLNSEQPEI